MRGTSALTWSKMDRSTLSKMRVQNSGVKAAPWYVSVSNSTSSALYLCTPRPTNVRNKRLAKNDVWTLPLHILLERNLI